MRGIELIVPMRDKSMQGRLLGAPEFWSCSTPTILLPLGIKNNIVVKSMELRLSSNPSSAQNDLGQFT